MELIKKSSEIRRLQVALSSAEAAQRIAEKALAENIQSDLPESSSAKTHSEEELHQACVERRCVMSNLESKTIGEGYTAWA